jgi:hypothetical protein
LISGSQDPHMWYSRNEMVQILDSQYFSSNTVISTPIRTMDVAHLQILANGA